MSNKGWIKLHRRIQEHWIYQERRQFSRYEAWIDLLLMANHRENRVLIDNELITVEKGQLITSIRKLCDRWDWSNTKVSNFLKLLQKDEMISYKSDTKKTVINICNYSVYHDSESGENDTETTRKHNGNISEAYQKHTNKNVKNVKNDKEDPTTTDARGEKNENDAIVFYQENIGFVRPIISQELLDWINDMGDEMVIEALKRAIAQNKPSWGYAKGILNSWYSKGIKTIKQAEAEDVEFRNRQQFRGKPQQSEVIPDWFGKQTKPEEKEIDEEEQKKIISMLQRHAGGND